MTELVLAAILVIVCFELVDRNSEELDRRVYDWARRAGEMVSDTFRKSKWK